MANSQEISSPIGLRIEYFEVRGQEETLEGKWVGADLELFIPPAGKFLLNLVTKEHYANQHLNEALFDTRTVERLLEDPCDREERQPFVLNDEVITDEVLDKKFTARVVEEDLARSLWPVESD